MLELSSAHLSVITRAENGFHRSLNDNTLEVISQLSRAVFTIQMQITT